MFAPAPQTPPQPAELHSELWAAEEFRILGLGSGFPELEENVLGGSEMMSWGSAFFK